METAGCILIHLYYPPTRFQLPAQTPPPDGPTSTLGYADVLDVVVPQMRTTPVFMKLWDAYRAIVQESGAQFIERGSSSGALVHLSSSNRTAPTRSSHSAWMTRIMALDDPRCVVEPNHQPPLVLVGKSWDQTSQVRQNACVKETIPSFCVCVFTCVLR